jgi:RluA family pseudouridine synthase
VGARREFPIDASYADGRLETFLRKHLGLPRTLALKAIRKGWIRLDGKRTKVDARLSSGSRVIVTNPALELPAIEGDRARAGAPQRARPVVPAPLVQRARASLRRTDEDVLVSAKPAGEVVHAGSAHELGWIDALAAAVGGEPVPIGRLDRDTSGLLVLGRNRAATRALFASLRDGSLQREYLALVHGPFDANEGLIDLPLAKVMGEDGRERVEPVDDEDTGSREARTRWRVVDRLRNATLLACRIETGRTHQIRAHLAAIGHPILGDPRYGGNEGAAGAVARLAGVPRLFLHAGVLEYPHPRTVAAVRVEEPLPPELARAVEQLRAATT